MMRKKRTTSRLRQKLTLQQEVKTADGVGGYARSWENVADLWAEIEPMSGRERLMAMQIESSISHRVMIRFRPDVTAGQRLVSSDGRAFNIRSVTRNNYGDKLEIMAEETPAT